MKLKAFGKTYNLELKVSNYVNNNRLYLWLIDTEDWCPFSDITENHPEISDSHIHIWKALEKVVIDNDFQMCFDTQKDCIDWLMKNLDEKWFTCIPTWSVNWLLCILILKGDNNEYWRII